MIPMKTEVKPLTPAEGGLSLIVCSGPRGGVRDNDWPCIAYTLQLQKDGKPIWTGEYRLGVGHVEPQKYRDHTFNRVRLTREEEQLVWTWQTKPHSQFVNKQLWAGAAAKLAQLQKVTPKLEDVAHSLLLDGSAYFDGNTFENWCADFGYSDDSIKAKETFEACDKIGRELSRALSREQVESLREWASNY